MVQEGRPVRAGKRMIPAVEAYLEQHSGEKFSLQEVAGAMHVNASYLARLYKAHTGRTLLWYHHFIRCEKAKVLLKDGEMSISEISEAVGFVTPSHFSRVFRQITGAPPSTWRDDEGG